MFNAKRVDVNHRPSSHKHIAKLKPTARQSAKVFLLRKVAHIFIHFMAQCILYSVCFEITQTIICLNRYIVPLWLMCFVPTHRARVKSGRLTSQKALQSSSNKYKQSATEPKSWRTNLWPRTNLIVNIYCGNIWPVELPLILFPPQAICPPFYKPIYLIFLFRFLLLRAKSLRF